VNNNISIALQILFGLLGQAQQIGTLIQQAKSEGRDDLTDTEVDTIVANYKADHAKLDADIAKSSG